MKTIEELDLDPIMKARAEELLARCPWAVFTSGRRGIKRQARAVAVNHIKDPARYLVETYPRAGKAFLAAVVALQAEDQRSVVHVADAIESVYLEHPEFEWKHKDGTCVDILPMLEAQGMPTAKGQQIIKFIRECPDTVMFLTKEGGLDVWHWQCRKAQPVSVDV